MPMSPPRPSRRSPRSRKPHRPTRARNSVYRVRTTGMACLELLLYIQLCMSTRSPTAQRIAHECLVLRARWLSRVVSRIYDEALRPHGIKGAQLNLLVAIALTGGVSPGDLAARFQMEKSTLSRNVRRLVANGWVLATNQDDARSLTLVLTPAGARLIEQIVPAWEQAQARTRAELGDDALAGLEELPLGPSHST
ncbi:MAG: winged helix-turn-helix transcriptional regulator [Myxococcales bacterium FL481]|nr:MAG: winged helix-turn-helix transcriptional regulator [Myxococcales bacterium FL481]